MTGGGDLEAGDAEMAGGGDLEAGDAEMAGGGHLDTEGRLRVVDVSTKAETLRRATAVCRLTVSERTLAALRGGELPKGDVLAVAQVAAVMAAKRVPELIPGCHPLRIGAVDVSFALTEGAVEVRAEVRGTERTGFEMEALTACAVAALTIYDMCKGVDPSMEIGGLRLVAKSGGRSEVAAALDGVRAAVVTVSTAAAAGRREDETGDLVEEWLRSHGATVMGRVVVPDDRERIGEAIRRAVAEGAQLVVTNGGTGVSPTDVTPEATLAVADRVVPGLAEVMRQASLRATPYAMLSRGVAVTVGGALVVNLPGSPKAVAENLDAIAPALGHAIELVRGGRPH